MTDHNSGDEKDSAADKLDIVESEYPTIDRDTYDGAEWVIVDVPGTWDAESETGEAVDIGCDMDRGKNQWYVSQGVTQGAGYDTTADMESFDEFEDAVAELDRRVDDLR